MMVFCARHAYNMINVNGMTHAIIINMFQINACDKNVCQVALFSTTKYPYDMNKVACQKLMQQQHSTVCNSYSNIPMGWRSVMRKYKNI